MVTSAEVRNGNASFDTSASVNSENREREFGPISPSTAYDEETSVR